ncbi:hypothetical protein [Caedibacter taeniospiralis]|uniref:Uncharacterized protein n=1 Tax=Caedibacter taeniospiralis TaxID=28907 RepID=Q6TFD4_CAETA|nr:hypothetical protein [Caedibacter taeniospiralis]AAR87125.1 hypothetical protein [Caedibacter taeniospiralis]
MIKVLIYALLSFQLLGCSMFGVKPVVINTEIETVILQNISIVDLCDISTQNVLYVDKDYNITMSNLLLYINDINESLAKSQLCLQGISDYNYSVLKQIKQK